MSGVFTGRTLRQACQCAVLAVVSYGIFRWAVIHGPRETGLVGTVLVAAVPIVLVAASVLRSSRQSVWTMLTVAAAMILALPVTLYPRTPDMAFHIGKVLWASRGAPVIDPAMGIPTPYPWVFHAVWGWLANISQTPPSLILRWASIWNVAGIAGTAWWVSRRTELVDDGHWLPWLCCLPLFAKDTSHILMATPSAFSFPFAVAGWWILAFSRNVRGEIIATILLVTAAAIWPGHLFALGGVVAVSLVRSRRFQYTGVVAISLCVALGIVLSLQAAAHAGGQSTAIQLLPSLRLADIGVALLHIASLGSDANGWLVTTASVALTGIFAALVVIGMRRRAQTRFAVQLRVISMGLLLGIVASAWFMKQAAFWSRMASLAGLVMTPFAVWGIQRLQLGFRSASHRVRRWGQMQLALVWLVPFLAASVYTAVQHDSWARECAPVVDCIRADIDPGDRIMATPEVLRDIVLGELPAYGFLGHHWPLYYGMPRHTADSIAHVYVALRDGSSVSPVITHQLQRAGVHFVVLKRPVDNTLSISQTLNEAMQPEYSTPEYLVYHVDQE